MVLQIVRIGDADPLGVILQGEHLFHGAVIILQLVMIQNDIIVLVHIDRPVAEHVDDFREFTLKLRRFQLRVMIVPVREEFFPTAHVRTKMTNAAGLADQLLTLGIGILPLIGR